MTLDAPDAFLCGCVSAPCVAMRGGRDHGEFVGRFGASVPSGGDSTGCCENSWLARK